ncbi:MAG: hypothetical protein FWG54_01980, partial [Bacteroidetes bacterium]|nr:hypothetical protein [Bacteroidota bacterium]
YVFLFMLGAMLLGGSALFAQPGKYGTGPDSTDCRNNLSFYRQYVQSNDLASAVSPWRKVLALCPRGVSQWPFTDGERIVKEWLMKQPEVTAERKAEMVDTLMLIYDIRVQNFPQNANGALLKKIFDLQTYRPEQDEVRYSVVEQYLNLAGDKADTDALMVYMDLTGKLFANEKRSAEAVMYAYSRTAEILEKQEAQAGKNESISDAKLFAENILMTSGVATCENLITLFTPRFEANPDDLGLIGNIVSMLSNSDCGSSDLYVQSVTALNRLDPSYKTAYYLYILHVSRGEMDLALKYLLENIESDDIPADEKGAHMVDLGKFYYSAGNTAKAMNAARSAMELNPTVRGKAYLLMGSIWASQKCGENDIEKRAPFWVAVDYYEKAKAADPSLASEANKLIAQYRQYFPLQEEAFMYDIMDGSSYTVTCGSLRETTTVRTRK